jgi:hypothetical protein
MGPRVRTPDYCRVALAAGTLLLGSGIAAARPIQNPRPVRPDEHGNAGRFLRAETSPQAHDAGKTAASRQPQNTGRVKVVYVEFTDNHGTNCDDPTQAGVNDGAPMPPIEKRVPFSLFEPVPGNTQGCLYLPFSTKEFPQDKNNPASATYGYGLLLMGGGGNSNSGFIAQSSLPFGVPVAPETPAEDLTDLNAAIRNLLATLSTAQPLAAGSGKALESSVHDRDVRVAAKNVPQPSASHAKAPG